MQLFTRSLCQLACTSSRTLTSAVQKILVVYLHVCFTKWLLKPVEAANRIKDHNFTSIPLKLVKIPHKDSEHELKNKHN